MVFCVCVAWGWEVFLLFVWVSCEFVLVMWGAFFVFWV